MKQYSKGDDIVDLCISREHESIESHEWIYTDIKIKRLSTVRQVMSILLLEQ